MAQPTAEQIVEAPPDVEIGADKQESEPNDDDLPPFEVVVGAADETPKMEADEHMSPTEQPSDLKQGFNLLRWRAVRAFGQRRLSWCA